MGKKHSKCNGQEVITQNYTSLANIIYCEIHLKLKNDIHCPSSLLLHSLLL